ncbi:efflux RND transporter permease subunit [Pseudohaliea rubra]|uniref:Cobalt-zinc-cadmium resistance protein CzcA, Cation efflux system protein CusA n=1 Tax=Pseudohaliea rubra DSM 19751 TaxID=1265313 RepID=A0A095VPD4_9GAMM|nr:CusA/CzcA family heavy metal efflux RND transporter [Pseudohaliea rubra]KGE02973.1 Cobalt-zinc-cadmium resistance protein CzcA, Cation efflux system protein CusA [Pseudohaliea rubra DSM 19751]
MIVALIRWSLHNRALVLLGTLGVVLAGGYAVYRTPVDAIPDLSDVQVIVKTPYPGQAPQVVEDQVTYPLSTALLSVPGAKTVRGFSFFGDSYVYVIFDDDTDLYWARSRVLEYLNQAASSLPEGVRPALGPDATGVGWVYLYALVDRSGRHDLAALRSLQDWFLRFELQTVPGVAEVATVGGIVKQYQVRVDPQKLRAYDVPLAQVQTAIRRGNGEQGASVLELAEAEYMVTTSGYIAGVKDLGAIPLGASAAGTPLQLRDVATIGLGPQLRRGIAELDGEGEVVGGIVVMRSGENARATIEGVKAKLEALRAGLPDGVELVTVYDRSGLIDRAVENLWQKLLEEFLVVALVCLLFLFHLRSSLVAVVSLPVGILAAFVVMQWQGINANIMSLGGIAIAVGAMIDGAIVLVENLHRHAEREPLHDGNRWQVVQAAAVEVGPALFFSLLIITVSFLPVFTLEAQEGRLFAPLAFTKTYAMAAAAALSVTLVPVLLGYFVRGRLRPEAAHPVNRLLVAGYRPLLRRVLRYPRSVLAVAVLLVLSALWPLGRLGSEFLPPLDEGDLMYMPTTYPGLSIGEARRLLQHTDKLIATVPEVERVFGKVGRAETATDPAPLTMIETFIQLRPRDQWRPGMTTEGLKAELDQLVKLPGVTNAWVMPIKTRIDMLATGIKTPVGIKVAGPDLGTIEAVGRQLESILENLPGTASVYSERVAGGRYVTVDIDRERAARYGLNIADVQGMVAAAVGGASAGEAVEGRERYPINLRYPQYWRASPEQLAELPIVTADGRHLGLGDVAHIRIAEGPPGIKSENARLNGWTFVDIAGIDVGQYVEAAQAAVASELELPAGYSLSWSGQYEYLERARARLTLVVPLTIALIAFLLYLNFRRVAEVAVILGTLPLALVGSLWLLYVLGYNLSAAVGVGFIALAGVAIETGVIMLVYLDQALADHEGAATLDREALREVVLAGATRRVRPVLMTAAATTLGLLPILLGSGTGSEVMSRIAAPMVGGMISATVLTLLVLPAVFLLWRGRGR